jgi:hypothetical protein
MRSSGSSAESRGSTRSSSRFIPMKNGVHRTAHRGRNSSSRSSPGWPRPVWASSMRCAALAARGRHTSMRSTATSTTRGRRGSMPSSTKWARRATYTRSRRVRSRLNPVRPGRAVPWSMLRPPSRTMTTNGRGSGTGPLPRCCGPTRPNPLPRTFHPRWSRPSSGASETRACGIVRSCSWRGVPRGSILETFVGEGHTGPDGLRVEGAVRLLRHLVSVAPRPWQLAPLTMLAWFEWARGQGSAAGDYLEDALSIGPGYELARLFEQLICSGRVPDWVGRTPS